MPSAFSLLHLLLAAAGHFAGLYHRSLSVVIRSTPVALDYDQIIGCLDELDREYPGNYLPGHTNFDLSLGKSFAEKYSVSVTALNVANRRVLWTTV